MIKLFSLALVLLLCDSQAKFDLKQIYEDENTKTTELISIPENKTVYAGKTWGAKWD